VLTLAGCSGDKSDSDDKAAPATAPATTASQAAQGGSGGGSTQQGSQGSGGAEETSAQLADGTHYAYLKTIDAARRTITVDVVQYFEGKAKEKAMREDGASQDAIETMDFYFRNTNPRLRTLTVAPDARISSGLYKDKPKTVELDELESQRPDPAIADWPFKLILQGGKVARMDEIFQS
jgi:hypothetical protein